MKRDRDGMTSGSSRGETSRPAFGWLAVLLFALAIPCACFLLTIFPPPVVGSQPFEMWLMLLGLPAVIVITLAGAHIKSGGRFLSQWAAWEFLAVWAMLAVAAIVIYPVFMHANCVT